MHIASFQYMNSLRAHIKKPSAVTKGKKKAILMNLNDEEEEEEGDEEMVAREAKCMEQLERALSKCQKCGDEKCCKIDKSGNHHTLTFQQRRSWAVALVRYLTCYVTID
jgi:predicted alpha/beta superfamily hydrolase